MKLSIIIVNYNVQFFLEQCLHSVEKAIQHINAEIFVVDNISSDGSVAMVKEKFPTVKLIENKENVGFSKANNQAIKIANGEYILLLNPDTVVEEDTFEKCIDFMDKHPEGGGLGVKMIDGNGVFLPESKRGLPTPSVSFYKISGLSILFPKSKIFAKYHLGYLDQNETNEIEILSGAYMWMRKSVIDEVGYLDETFFMYGEDIDLSYRILKGGYKNYYFPEAKIIHYKGESTKKSSINYVFVFYNAMIIFAKKHFTKRAKWFAFFINIAIYFRAFIAILNRFILKILNPLKNLLSNNKKVTKRTLVVGNRVFVKDTAEFLKRKNSKLEKIIAAKPDNFIQDNEVRDYTGKLYQLADLVEIYDVNEVIFSTNDVKYKDIIFQMNKIKNKLVECKNSLNTKYIVGSQTVEKRTL